MLSLIAAMAKNQVIGVNNTMPWYLPTDLKRFKQLTLNHAVIMGRKTFESLKKPLVDRQNIVVSKDTEFQAAGCDIFTSLEAAIDQLSSDVENFVIGGGQIFEICLPMVDKLYLSQIHKDFEGDTWFPKIDFNLFELIFDQHVHADKHPYDFKIWRRKTLFESEV